MSVNARPEGAGASPHPAYRPDIDGLRAIAVLSVVGYHAFPSRVKAGFIGVDIFFVISGFLISSIIMKGLDAGRFSFADFYSRRVRRIFPALITVLAACFVYGWFTLFAQEFAELGFIMMAGAAFFANFALWSTSGYFGPDAEAMPLLRDLTRNGVRIHEITEQVVRLEGDADDAHAKGLKRAFQSQSDRPMQFMVSREIYKHLERITDAFEDVANEIDGIVIDHA